MCPFFIAAAGQLEKQIQRLVARIFARQAFPRMTALPRTAVVGPDRSEGRLSAHL